MTREEEMRMIKKMFSDYYAEIGEGPLTGVRPIANKKMLDKVLSIVGHDIDKFLSRSDASFITQLTEYNNQRFSNLSPKQENWLIKIEQYCRGIDEKRRMQRR